MHTKQKYFIVYYTSMFILLNYDKLNTISLVFSGRLFSFSNATTCVQQLVAIKRYLNYIRVVRASGTPFTGRWPCAKSHGGLNLYFNLTNREAYLLSFNRAHTRGAKKHENKALL